MKRLVLFALLILMIGANVLFAAVNYKETLLTPGSPNAKTGDSTRAQLIAAANWWDIFDIKVPPAGFVGPGMVRIMVVTNTADTDCDSVTVAWLTSVDGTNYVTRDSTELTGQTNGESHLFTANVEDSVYQYNLLFARPQCNDAAAGLMKFSTYLYLYDGLGQVYAVRKWENVVFKQAAGGGI